MSTRARSLANYHVFYGDTNLINTELDRYMAVKREDLQRVAKEYLRPDRTQILRFPVPKSDTAPNPASPVTEPAAAQ